MSSFSCPLVEVEISAHDNADALEVARVFGYWCVVPKGEYVTGDKAVYIPEASIVPDGILEKMGLLGKLNGPQHNRVKAIKLRGLLSQGLLYRAPEGIVASPDGSCRRFALGEDVSEFLGIEKYEPEIPFGMAGDVMNLGTEHVPHYDIENIKNHPELIKDGEYVVMTEKIHGTFCGVGIMPFERDELIEKRIAVFSKGLGSQGLVFKENSVNSNNLYVRTIKSCGVDRFLLDNFGDSTVPVFIMGEIFGKGVQDLDYGMKRPEFRTFDLAFGAAGDIEYLPEMLWSDRFLSHFKPVEVLYRGPYSKEVMMKVTSGKETISGGTHLREGVVIRPVEERYSHNIGRVIVKSVSEEYLLRKGGTEYK